MTDDPITFSFGENWESLVRDFSEERVRLAQEDIVRWVGEDRVRGRRVLDIGCGSGLHSLVFGRLGASELFSFDLDPRSVAATQSLWERAGKPRNWKIAPGSILDDSFLEPLLRSGGFDLVYGWGVLHHTGAMWHAVENAASLVPEGGLLWLALYNKTAEYPAELALKQRYNRASRLGKRFMVAIEIAAVIGRRLRVFCAHLYHRRFGQLFNPLAWNESKGRGMDVYHDIVDWLGGLPYEVATVEEVCGFLQPRGFKLEQVQTGEANNIFLFSRLPDEP